AADLNRTSQFEPDVYMVGFDPARDAGFGTFHLAGGGSTDARNLQPGQAIATQHLADQIGLKVGDTVQMSFVEPTDPILPRIFWTNGTATSVDATILPGGLPIPPAAQVSPQPSRHAIPVERNATLIAVGLYVVPSPAGGNLTGLHAHLTNPAGK